MSLDTALARFRQRERAMFRSTCTISRPIGTPVFDRASGTYTNPSSPVYQGPCMVRPESRSGIDVQAGETELRLLDYVVKVPADTPVEVNDQVLVTASPDAACIGLPLKVTDVPKDDWQVSRRLICEEVV